MPRLAAGAAQRPEPAPEPPLLASAPADKRPAPDAQAQGSARSPGKSALSAGKGWPVQEKPRAQGPGAPDAPFLKGAGAACQARAPPPQKSHGPKPAGALSGRPWGKPSPARRRNGPGGSSGRRAPRTTAAAQRGARRQPRCLEGLEKSGHSGRCLEGLEKIRTPRALRAQTLPETVFARGARQAPRKAPAFGGLQQKSPAQPAVLPRAAFPPGLSLARPSRETRSL
jgi:hypothetical protein